MSSVFSKLMKFLAEISLNDFMVSGWMILSDWQAEAG